MLKYSSMCESVGAVGVVPDNVDAGVQVTFSNFGYVVVPFENLLLVVGMLDANIFNAKIVGYEGEHDGVSFVSPEARGHIKLVVAGFVEEFLRCMLTRMPDWGSL